ncbi:MAG: flagellar hook-basal body complex protein FliE [Kyrpidia sp.]|nr:flagellar hook-basal body complex protein FliE [Kyrpidia sp.]
MIPSVDAIGSALGAGGAAGTTAGVKPNGPGGFAEWFGRALDQVGQLQQQADDVAARFVAGQGPDVHDVMIAAQQAFLALQTVVQIRDRAVEAYQEMMRMQI